MRVLPYYSHMNILSWSLVHNYVVSLDMGWSIKAADVGILSLNVVEFPNMFSGSTKCFLYSFHIHESETPYFTNCSINLFPSDKRKLAIAITLQMDIFLQVLSMVLLQILLCYPHQMKVLALSIQHCPTLLLMLLIMLSPYLMGRPQQLLRDHCAVLKE